MTQVNRKQYQLRIGRDNSLDRLETLERSEGNDNVREHFNKATGKLVAYTVNDRDYFTS